MFDSSFVPRMKQFRTIINRNGKDYFVSTNDTYDHGFETMIFPCDANGKITDWGELYAKVYDSIEEATEGHKNACDSFQPTTEDAYGEY